jgi:3-phosphoshikimate 1-carboxyvinyltransferase
LTSWLAFPPADEVRGAVRVPSSKSATNRALVLAALAGSRVEIVRPLESDDTRVLARCLRAMGARIETAGDGLAVTGPLGVSGERVVELDAGESGTAARFLAAIATAIPGNFRLTGAPRLRQRPMGPLVEALRRAGAEIREEAEAGRLPLRIRGGTRPRGRVEVDASESSQYLSALLLLGAAGAARGSSDPLEVSAAGPIASEPYVATTADSLAAFGYRVERTGATWSVASVASVVPSAGSRAPVARYETPGDYSSAVPLLAAAGICGGEVVVRGLRWPSNDADARALPALERMGVEIETSSDEIVARGQRGRLRPASIAASEFPDAVPALAAVAAFAPGESRFEGISHLRIKESDRLTAIARVIELSGRGASDDASSLTIRGRSVAAGAGEVIRDGGNFPTFGDHRIAMAGALVALVLGGVRIENPGCVAKSYPDFFRDLDALATRRGRAGPAARRPGGSPRSVT